MNCLQLFGTLDLNEKTSRAAHTYDRKANLELDNFLFERPLIVIIIIVIFFDAQAQILDNSLVPQDNGTEPYI